MCDSPQKAAGLYLPAPWTDFRQITGLPTSTLVGILFFLFLQKADLLTD